MACLVKWRNKMKNEVKSFSIFLQLYLSGLTLIVLLMCLYTNIFYYLLYILVASILFIQSYNNEKLYKRKNMTYVYLLVAILLLCCGIINAI